MSKIPKEWHEDNHPLKGYKWKVRAENGTIQITEDELFSREEFVHFREHEQKVAYAMDLGWRFNMDNQRWYRIKGY